MATKTISIDLEAYDRLVKARLSPDESFSKVIHRAVWREKRNTGAALLEALRRHAPMSKETLAVLDRAQREDKPPLNRWK